MVNRLLVWAGENSRLERVANTNSLVAKMVQSAATHPDTRLAIQAYLRRTPEDLDSLVALKPRIRLVKGAYAEPIDRALHDLADKGYRVGVYIPFGSAWYPYLMRRMAERPANLLFFLRTAAGR